MPTFFSSLIINCSLLILFLMIFWSQFPFFRILVPFILGIISSNIFWNNNYLLLFLLLFLSTIEVVFMYHKSWNKRFGLRIFHGVLFNLVFFFVGSFLSSQNNLNIKENAEKVPVNDTANYVGYLMSPPIQKGKYWKTRIRLKEENFNQKKTELNTDIVCYLSTDSIKSPIYCGDLIEFNAVLKEIKSPPNPDMFDQKKYLVRQGILLQTMVPSGCWKKCGEDEGNPVINYAYKLRSKVLESYSLVLTDKNEFAVGSAMVTGYTDALESDLMLDYSAAGVIHVLSVSGLHVGLIYLFLNSILFFMDKKKSWRVMRSLIILFFIWFYSMMTGMSPSVMRSAAMLTILIIGKTMNSHVNVFNAMLASCLLLLCFDPNLIMDVGFQFSYLSLTGILVLHPYMYLWYNTTNKWLDKSWGMIAASLSAQLTTAPLCLYYFHQFPVYFLPANLVAIPLSTGVMFAGIIYTLVAFIGPLGFVVGKIFSLSLWLMNHFMELIHSLPYSVAGPYCPDVWQVMIIYLGIAFFCIYFIYKNKTFFFAGLFSVVIYIGMINLRHYQTINQKEFIRYSIPGHIACEFVSGDQSVFV